MSKNTESRCVDVANLLGEFMRKHCSVQKIYEKEILKRAENVRSKTSKVAIVPPGK